MGCFVLLFALISPRLAIIATWLFSQRPRPRLRRMARAGDRVLHAALDDARLRLDVRHRARASSVEGLEWIVVGIAVLCDLGSLLGGSRSRR